MGGFSTQCFGDTHALLGQCFTGGIPEGLWADSCWSPGNCIPLMPFDIPTSFLPFLLPPSLPPEIEVLPQKSGCYWREIGFSSYNSTEIASHPLLLLSTPSWKRFPLSTSSLGRSLPLLPNNSDPYSVILVKKVSLVIPPSTVCPNSSLFHSKGMLESPSGRLDS